MNKNINKNDWVLCIKEDNYHNITKGKKYKIKFKQILKSGNIVVFIKNDRKSLQAFYWYNLIDKIYTSPHFIKISDFKQKIKFVKELL